MTDEAFGDWLRQARQAAGLTQDQLAERSGVAVRTIRELENGRIGEPRAATARALRTVLAPSGDAAPAPAAGLYLRVLGPVELWRDGTRVDLGAVQRRILGYLGVRVGRLVPVDALAEAVWEGRPGRAALHSQISRLRRLLSDGDGDARIEYSDGYRLVAADAEVDLLALRRARSDADTADPATALGVLAPVARAIAGPVLADLPQLASDPEVRAVAEEVRAAMLALAEVAVAAGQPDAVLAPVRSAAEADPLDEGLCAGLMRLLAAAGRRAEALSRFRTLRERLVDELGVDPGPELTDVFERVLRNQPPEMPAAAEPTPVPVPAQLPAAVADFTGRGAQVRLLNQLLTATPGGGVPVVVVTGTGGIGKTSLAVQVAHQVRDRFPDGQLFIDLQGAGPHPLPPGEVLAGFLDALGAGTVPPDLPGRAGLFRSLVADRRVLVVLDNARDTAQITDLVPGTSGNAVLVTSRHTAAAGLPGARLVELPVLPGPEMLDLLAAMTGARRVADEPDAAGAVVAACGGLPLAVRVAGARLGARPRWRVRDLADRLAGGGRLGRLDRLDASHAIRACFQLSYDMLDPAPAALFRMLGRWPGPDIDLNAAAALYGGSLVDTERLLDALTDAHLLDAPSPGRYHIHDLLHDYAAELAASDPPECWTAALDRVLRYGAVTARRGNDHWVPGSLSSAPEDAVTSPYALEVADRHAAERWFATNGTEMVALAETAPDHAGLDLYPVAWLTVPLFHLFQRRNDRPMVDRLARLGKILADRLPQRRDAVRMARMYAVWLFDEGRLDEARDVLTGALAEYRRLGDVQNANRCLETLGFGEFFAGRFEAAEKLFVEALAGHRAAGDRDGEIGALIGLVQALFETGHNTEAEGYARQIITLSAALGNPYKESMGHGTLAQTLLNQGRYAEALRPAQRALELCREAGDGQNESANLTVLAATYRHLGDFDAALDHSLLAVTRQSKVGGGLIVAEALVELGKVLHAVGRTTEARARWRAALPALDALGHPSAAEVRALIAAPAGAPIVTS